MVGILQPTLSITHLQLRPKSFSTVQEMDVALENKLQFIWKARLDGVML